ncbi:MAG TPA: DNA primase [Planctomycetaceae bacterium]|nr:DNA primase [Planctomycetaceae bacterium]
MSSGVGSDFKELVRARTDIVQLVGERVALQSRRGGREFMGLCPFHDDHNPSFRVDPDRQSFKCWVCDVGGDCFAFVEKTESVGFYEALELLATRAGLEMPRRSANASADGKPTRKELFDVLKWAESEFYTCLKTSSEAATAREYLKSRNFNAETIEKFRLGYAPLDGQFLQRRGRDRFNPAQLAAVRLISQRSEGEGYYEYFRGRVMFPIRDASARTVAFGGRVLPGVGSPDAPKYLNSADSLLFAKNRLVFALDVARPSIAERDSCVVMEGYADCIMAHQFGISNAVATLGTALTENHVGVLKRFTRKVVLVFDGDQAGRDAAEKSLPRFLSQEVDLRILTLTTDKDPADFLTAKGAEAFGQLLDSAPEAWEYKLRLSIERHGLASMDARDNVVDEMLELFRQAPRFHGSIRENIALNRLASRVGLREDDLRKRLVADRRTARTSAVSKTQLPNSKSPTSAAPTSAKDKLERELLECLIADPTAILALREVVAIEDFSDEAHRRLLALCYRLADSGLSPSYETVIAATEEADLKNLLVTLEATARDKMQTRRVDGPQAVLAAQQALLSDSLQLWKRRVATHAASIGRLAVQTDSPGTLDAAQLDHLRRAMEIHGERARANTTT